MAFNRNVAAKLCTAAELELFLASTAQNIGEIAPARLRSKIQRSRRLRDKYQDLLRRQRISTRERTGAKGGRQETANFRTEQKAKLFAEVLSRFEKRLDQIEKAQKRAAEREAAKAARMERQAKAAAARKTAKPKRTKVKAGYVSSEARGASRDRRLLKAGRKAIHSHISARGRRHQAKRDSR